jgi:broad specificity phosphatase PhoE
MAGILLIGNTATFAQTTIWLVRHAEKAEPSSTAMMLASDPDLNEEGKQRATALATELKPHKVAAVFVTLYKRTGQTGEPTLKQFKLTDLQTYDPAKLPAFVKKFRGNTKAKMF